MPLRRRWARTSRGFNKVGTHEPGASRDYSGGGTGQADESETTKMLHKWAAGRWWIGSLRWRGDLNLRPHRRCYRQRHRPWSACNFRSGRSARLRSRQSHARHRRRRQLPLQRRLRSTAMSWLTSANPRRPRAPAPDARPYVRRPRRRFERRRACLPRRRSDRLRPHYHRRRRRVWVKNVEHRTPTRRTRGQPLQRRRACRRCEHAYLRLVAKLRNDNAQKT